MEKEDIKDFVDDAKEKINETFDEEFKEEVKEKCEELKKVGKVIGNKNVKIKYIFYGVILIAVFTLFVAPKLFQKELKKETITVSRLTKMIKDSELSTYSMPYDGIAEKHNEKKPEKIEYYVSYKGTVEAGIDMNEIKIRKDDEQKLYIIIIPETKLTKTNLDEKSLDFMIQNKKYKQDTIFAEAHNLALQDFEIEASNNKNIIECAEENAKTVIRGLVEPFTKDTGYAIAFEKGK